MPLALNVFKTVSANITTSNTAIYTAPTGYTGIVLMAQVTNVTASASTVTCSHFNGSTETELVKNFAIPGADAASVITGKLVLETGHQFKCSAGANGIFKVTLSVLESANS